MYRTMGIGWVIAVAMAVAAPGWAAVPGSGLRLHLESNLFEIGTGEVDPEGPADADNYSGAEVGIGMTRGSVGLGYFFGSGFVVGGRLTLGQEASDWVPGSEGESFVWGILPYFEYVFLRSVVRPFVTAEAGFEGMHDDGMSFWGFKMGGGGGVHFFFRQEVSLDLTALLSIRFGSGHWDAGPFDDVDFGHWRFSAAGIVGLSAWL